MKQFISWTIIKRLTESESILLKQGIEAHFGLACSPSGNWFRTNFQRMLDSDGVGFRHLS